MPPVDATPEAVARANEEERRHAWRAFAASLRAWTAWPRVLLLFFAPLLLVLVYPAVVLVRDLRTARRNAAGRTAELERASVADQVPPTSRAGGAVDPSTDVTAEGGGDVLPFPGEATP